MTENVHVENANWATEDSLKKLLGVIEKHFGKSEKLQKDISDSLKNGKNSIADASKHINDHSKSIQSNDKELQKSIKSVQGLNAAQLKGTKSQQMMNHAVDSAKNALSGLTSGLVSSLKTIRTSLIAVSLGVLKRSTEYFTLSLDLERDGLSSVLRAQTGAATALQGLAQITSISGLTLGTTNKLLKEFGGAIGKYGVDEFAGGVRTITRNLASFGVTTDEAGTFLARYLEQQRVQGVLDNVNQMATQRAAREALKNTIGFSKALRLSREEILRRQEQALDSIDAKFLISRLKQAGIDVENEYRNAASALGPDLANIILDGASNATFRGTAMASEQLQAIAQQGGYEIAEVLADVSQAIAAGNKIDYERLQNRINALDPSRLDDILGALGPESEQAKAAIVKLREFAGTYSAAELERADSAAQAQANLISIWQELQGSLQSMIATVIGSEGVVESIKSFINNGLRPMIEMIIKNLPAIQRNLQKFINFITGKLSTGLSKFADLMTGLMSGEKTITDVFVDVGKGLAVGLFNAIKDIILTPWGAFLTAVFFPKLTGMLLKNAGKLAVGGARLAGSAAASAPRALASLSKLMGPVVKAAPFVYGAINGVIDAVGDMKDTWNKSGSILETSMVGIASYGTGFFDAIISGTTSLVDTITFGVFDLNGKWEEYKISIDNVMKSYTDTVLDYVMDDPLAEYDQAYEKIKSLTLAQMQERLAKLEEEKDSFFTIFSDEEEAEYNAIKDRIRAKEIVARENARANMTTPSNTTVAPRIKVPSTMPTSSAVDKMSSQLQEQNARSAEMINKAIETGDSSALLKAMISQIQETNRLLKDISGNTADNAANVYGK